MFTTSRSTVTPISVTAISCGFIVQLVSTVDKILTDIASRGPSEVAELLVFSHVKFILFPVEKDIYIVYSCDPPNDSAPAAQKVPCFARRLGKCIDSLWS